MQTTLPKNAAEPGTPAKTICDYRKDLHDELAASESKQLASTSKIAGWETALGYRLCTVAETQKTLGYYRDLDNYELFDIQQSAAILAANVAKYTTWDDDLTKFIKEASKMLNQLKSRMLDANNAACAMRNCLQSIIGFTDTDIPPQLQAVTELTKSLSEKSQQAAEAMVTIAGVHTFADLKPLKQFVQDLAATVKNLKTLTDGYFKTAGDDLKEAQTELTKIIDELNTEMFESAERQSAINGTQDALGFICGTECRPIDDLEDICEEVSGLVTPDSASGGNKTKRPADEE